ncbi:MAG: FHA domain-containing protein [Cyanobacteria bacterium P01_A01_bin.3]
MDTPNDWTEDGYETQLIAVETSLVPVETQLIPLPSSSVSVEAQRGSSETQLICLGPPTVSGETQLAPLDTQLVPVDDGRASSGSTTSISTPAETNSPTLNPAATSGQVADSNTAPPARLSTDSKAADYAEFPAKNAQQKIEEGVSQAFLDYFLTYPIIRNLRAADLLTKQEVLEAALIWKQMGGKLEHVLVERMGIKSTTIKFFHNNEAGTSAKEQGCKRIGEFLRAAGLVSEGEIQFVLEELKTQGRRLKLGDALVEQGLVKQSTINYFANRFVKEGLDFGEDTSEGGSVAEHINDDSHFRMDEFFFVVGQHGQFSSHTLRTRMYSIGRAVGNDIVVNDRFVSRRHAYLIRTQDKDTHATTYEVLDCGKIHKYSTNGIYVNGKKVKHQALKPGDVVHIGPKIHARFLPVE